MSKRGARVSAFSHLTFITSKVKSAYKKYTARRNRRKLHQSRHIENHIDKKLNAWDLD